MKPKHECPDCQCGFQRSETPGLLEVGELLAANGASRDFILQMFSYVPWTRKLQDDGLMQKPAALC